ncbi:sperm acrosome membrane-associated protein 6 [Cinclus cinclus]|uniref:sperm acrosome membrane-associated protein 6 n=1 Tax=Cinclus cinclus TaxID=127875 RepID=UPI002E0EFEDC
MGWWFVALILVLVSWYPGNPGLWLWVLMSCLSEVHPCLLCFGPPLQRARLCSDITGAFVNDPRHKKCHEALVEAAKPLASITVGSGQREELREIVMDAMHFLEEQSGNSEQKPLNESLQEAVDTIWAKLSQLGKVPACIPPCGFQPAARVFQCATCRFVDCQFALDCPVQDLWTYTDETIVLHCNVPFNIPTGLPVTWLFVPNKSSLSSTSYFDSEMFIGDKLLWEMRFSATQGLTTLTGKKFFLHVQEVTFVYALAVHPWVYVCFRVPGVWVELMCPPMAQLRTQDMTLFKKLKGNPEKPFSLTIEEPAPGTVACHLGEPSKPIIRKFFYLNVSEGSVEEEKELQGVFSTVLHWLDDENPQPYIPALGLAVAAGSIAFILLLIYATDVDIRVAERMTDRWIHSRGL